MTGQVDNANETNYWRSTNIPGWWYHGNKGRSSQSSGKINAWVRLSLERVSPTASSSSQKQELHMKFLHNAITLNHRSKVHTVRLTDKYKKNYSNIFYRREMWQIGIRANFPHWDLWNNIGTKHVTTNTTKQKQKITVVAVAIYLCFTRKTVNIANHFSCFI